MNDELCRAFIKMTKSRRRRAEFLNEALREMYPRPVCALQYKNDPFRLLVMARLSAQCTDKRVNLVSEALFSAFPDAPSMAAADTKQIEDIIRPCGLYRTKAKNLKDAAQIICDKHSGAVPSEPEALLALPGVGRKIANLIMGDCFGKPAIVSDTHCIRIAYRLGITTKNHDPLTNERELTALIPEKDRSDFCHRIVDFGRDYCKAQGRKCEQCPVKEKIEEQTK